MISVIYYVARVHWSTKLYDFIDDEIMYKDRNW